MGRREWDDREWDGSAGHGDVCRRGGMVVLCCATSASSVLCGVLIFVDVSLCVLLGACWESRASVTLRC